MLRTHWDDLVDEEDVEDIEPAKYWDEANGEIVEGLVNTAHGVQSVKI